MSTVFGVRKECNTVVEYFIIFEECVITCFTKCNRLSKWISDADEAVLAIDNIRCDLLTSVPGKV